MAELRFPWLMLGVMAAWLGGVWIKRFSDVNHARKWSVRFSGIALGFASGAWLDFEILGARQAHDRWDIFGLLGHGPVLVIDELSAPMLPLAALLYFLTNLATLRTKAREFSFARSLCREAILLATLSTTRPWLIVLLLVLAVIPIHAELRHARRLTRIYIYHMGIFAGLLIGGQCLMTQRWIGEGWQLCGVLMLTVAVLMRSGIVPVHTWMTDLFEHATFGTALLTFAPMVGAYGVIRLVLPTAPEWVLRWISLISLATAIYAAGMALVQRDARRFFCFLFLSHSSLVLVGLETGTPLGLTGALSLWLSIALSLSGFGLTMRCVEARLGRISLGEFHGLHSQIPMLAALFLLTGMASIGFPGTAGFVGLELLVEGVVQATPWVGASIVIVTALNGLAVMHAYFRIFGGKTHEGTIDLRIRFAERISVLLLTALIIGGGLYPQPGIMSRYRAAKALARERERNVGPSRNPLVVVDHSAKQP